VTDQTILLPAMLLVLWTLIMLLWMVITRFPSMAKNAKKLNALRAGARGDDLNGVLPDSVMWKAHNYDHLLQQPTIFYATVFTLVFLEQGTGTNTILAWLYFGIRIVHSIWQATVNRVLPVRVGLFALSSIIVLVLAIRATWAVFHGIT